MSFGGDRLVHGGEQLINGLKSCAVCRHGLFLHLFCQDFSVRLSSRFKTAVMTSAVENSTDRAKKSCWEEKRSTVPAKGVSILEIELGDRTLTGNIV